MKMSANSFLSSLGLRYGRQADLQGSPEQIVKNLLALTAAYDAGTYETPGFVVAPLTSAAVNPANVAKETELVQAYRDALATGIVSKVHKALAAIDKLRMKKGGPAEPHPSDFEILAHQQTPLGAAARWIMGCDLDLPADVHVAGTDEFFDHFGGAIRKYAKAK